MEPTGTSPGIPVRSPSAKREKRSVSPVFPLILLETMRDRDRPDEVLEDEDISTSLPRRLGLSDVVQTQIRRFQIEVKQRRAQVPSQVEDLIRLVIRRPDSEEIFSEAGRRVAEHFWEERPSSIRATVRRMPRPLALLSAQRAGRRMFKVLVGPTPFKLSRRPMALRIDDTLTARADHSGAACAFYTGAFRALLELYTGRRYRVLHPECGSRVEGGRCMWSVEIAS